jgi:hypothetical protein
MEAGSSLWRVQESATGPCPESDASSPQIPALFPSHLRLGLTSFLLPSCFPTKAFYC